MIPIALTCFYNKEWTNGQTIFCSILVSILSCTMCVEIYTEGPPACRNMYLWYTLPAASSIDKRDLPLQRRLIDEVVGFSTVPIAVNGALTHPLYVSLVSSQMETVSKMCLLKIGLYCLALLNSPHEEAYKHLFRGLLVT